MPLLYSVKYRVIEIKMLIDCSCLLNKVFECEVKFSSVFKKSFCIYKSYVTLETILTILGGLVWLGKESFKSVTNK